MKYRRTFSAVITIFPDFYRNEYFDYMKEKLNNWIFQCFNTYSDYFTISVVQPSGIAKFYEYDKNINKENILFDKIWKNPYGSYHIILEGAGDVLCGICEKLLLPPKELQELTLANINIKYKEFSSLTGSRIIAFGKESGLPCEYDFGSSDLESWRNIISDDISCIAQDWKISVHASKTISDYIFNILNKVIDLSPSNSKYIKLEIDEDEGLFEAKGSFLLKPEYKEKYFALFQELTEFSIHDDLFEVEDLKMDFVAIDKKIFYFEKYNFNDIVGNFQKKSIIL